MHGKISSYATWEHPGAKRASKQRHMQIPDFSAQPLQRPKRLVVAPQLGPLTPSQPSQAQAHMLLLAGRGDALVDAYLVLNHLPHNILICSNHEYGNTAVNRRTINASRINADPGPPTLDWEQGHGEYA
ncbi:hypothetical protein MIND_00645700 [Mycena indigotica]|uniref:Uncharacterized protein n=1 Tax=Mycena indigotica TaxID=2126181 RepID=A0A8H6SSA1_9AGAR|nr:uncharacterized protein MIND_00645700 [Mycena indigotica]KAF7304140.1 hypothetical protein MIND_00645700 [Mycena indigotica]